MYSTIQPRSSVQCTIQYTGQAYDTVGCYCTIQNTLALQGYRRSVGRRKRNHHLRGYRLVLEYFPKANRPVLKYKFSFISRYNAYRRSAKYDFNQQATSSRHLRHGRPQIAFDSEVTNSGFSIRFID